MSGVEAVACVRKGALANAGCGQEVYLYSTDSFDADDEDLVYDQHAIDTLRAQLEAAEADAARWKFIKAWGRQIEVVSTGECNFGISTPTWRGTWFDLDAAIDAARAEAKA